MRMLRFFHARRFAVCVSLLGTLLLVSGCGDSNPINSVAPEEGKAKGEAQQRAREQAYGKGGVPKTEKGATKK